jgi:Nucleotidyltransferase of unknown function (DUF6036)
MALQILDLWSLVRGLPQLDPHDLAAAVAQQAEEEDLDYRTCLLIRDSVEALKNYWGLARFERWLEESPARDQITEICRQEYERIGFPTIRKRLMDKTAPETIRQLLEYLGQRLQHPQRIYIAGSIALILPGYLSRHTDDIDVVDEVPADIRNDHALMHELQTIFGLHLGHVQSHYFPAGWRDRAHSLAPFGKLQVFLLDPDDVFLSKLFSGRVKDMQDMRVLAPQLEREPLAEKLKMHAQAFLADPQLLVIAQNNWKVLFGEDLPP